MQLRHVLLVLTILHVGNGLLLANNNAFLPGDAFFHARVTASDVQAALENGELRLKYVRIQEMAFCGYAGYTQLSISDPSGKVTGNLRIAYEKVREYRPAQFVRESEEESKVAPGTRDAVALNEINGVSVLIYNRSFSFDRYKLCVEYNETWVSDVKAFGHIGEHVRLNPLINSAQAVEESWRNSANVAPLAVRLPKGAPEVGRWIEEPITIEKEFKIVVLRDYEYDSYFRGRRPLPVFVVDQDGMAEFEYDRKERSWKKYEE